MIFSIFEFHNGTFMFKNKNRNVPFFFCHVPKINLMYNYSYKFVIKASGHRKDGTTPVYLQVFINKRRKRFSLNVFVRLADWDAKRMMVKVKAERSKHINEIIFKAKAKIDDVFYKSILTETPLTIELFREYFFNEKVKTDFLAFMKTEIEESSEMSKGTRKAYRQAYQHLSDFSANIRFMDLTYDFVQRFDRHMKAKGLGLNTVAKHHKNVKLFIHTAIIPIPTLN